VRRLRAGWSADPGYAGVAGRTSGPTVGATVAGDLVKSRAGVGDRNTFDCTPCLAAHRGQCSGVSASWRSLTVSRQRGQFTYDISSP
jgi:hypothetical protein